MYVHTASLWEAEHRIDHSIERLFSRFVQLHTQMLLPHTLSVLSPCVLCWEKGDAELRGGFLPHKGSQTDTSVSMFNISALQEAKQATAPRQVSGLDAMLVKNNCPSQF